MLFTFFHWKFLALFFLLYIFLEFLLICILNIPWILHLLYFIILSPWFFIYFNSRNTHWALYIFTQKIEKWTNSLISEKCHYVEKIKHSLGTLIFLFHRLRFPYLLFYGLFYFDNQLILILFSKISIFVYKCNVFLNIMMANL